MKEAFKKPGTWIGIGLTAVVIWQLAVYIKDKNKTTDKKSAFNADCGCGG